MAIGDTLLKFTDYPFAYSVIGMLVGSLGSSIHQNELVFLGISGAFGTFLTIWDPLGDRLRKVAEKRIRDKNKSEKAFSDIDLQFRITAIKSKSITIEMDRVIGLTYFVLLILGFMIAVVAPTSFFEKIQILDQNKQPLFDTLYMKMLYVVLSIIAFGILAYKATTIWQELDKKIDIAGYHLTMINDDDITSTSMDNMTRAIEQNDWELADLWGDRIAEEKQNRKGKRELILRLAEKVYTPLHLEASNNFKLLNRSIPEKSYHSLSSDVWIKIKDESLHILIEEPDERNIIDEHYKQINEYNNIVGISRRKIGQFILNRFSETYNMKINGLYLTVNYQPNNSEEIALEPCAMFNDNPLSLRGSYSSFVLHGTHVLENGNQSNFRISEIDKLRVFSLTWQNVESDVATDPTINRMKELFQKIQSDTKELLKNYSEKIEMQKMV